MVAPFLLAPFSESNFRYSSETRTPEDRNSSKQYPKSVGYLATWHNCISNQIWKPRGESADWTKIFGAQFLERFWRFWRREDHTLLVGQVMSPLVSISSFSLVVNFKIKKETYVICNAVQSSLGIAYPIISGGMGINWRATENRDVGERYIAGRYIAGVLSGTLGTS